MSRGRCRELLLLRWMKPGQRGRVYSFAESNEPVIRRLVVLGFLPGEDFVLERNRPDYLIRFGYTRIAINRGVAGKILVRILAGKMGKPGGRDQFVAKKNSTVP